MWKLGDIGVILRTMRLKNTKSQKFFLEANKARYLQLRLPGLNSNIKKY